MVLICQKNAQLNRKKNAIQMTYGRFVFRFFFPGLVQADCPPNDFSQRDFIAEAMGLVPVSLRVCGPCYCVSSKEKQPLLANFLPKERGVSQRGKFSCCKPWETSD